MVPTIFKKIIEVKWQLPFYEGIDTLSEIYHKVIENLEKHKNVLKKKKEKQPLIREQIASRKRYFK